MPFEKVKYTLEIPVGLTFESMQFDDNDPIDPDDLKPTDTPGKYEDTLEDQAINESGKVNVYVDMSGTNGLEWSLTVQVGGESLDDNPIEEKASDGRADHSDEHSYG